MPTGSQVLILLSFLFLFVSCYEKKEGCLDVLAKNFVLDADISCCENPDDCCCEYPVLSWRIKQQYEEANLSSADVYYTKLGQPFRIEKILFFVSNIRLTDIQSYAVDDTIRIEESNGQVLDRPDDVTLLSSSLFTAEFGVFNRPGSYTMLEFTVGLSEPERSADRHQFVAPNPLAPSQAELRDSINDQWLTYDISWVPDTTSGEIVHLTIPADVNVTVTLPVDVSKDPGEDLTLSLSIDYARWFEEIDLGIDDQATIQQKILAGLAKSFFIL